MHFDRKNIFLIAYYYPPINNGGTARPAAMKKYLEKLGYKVFIVTNDNEGNCADEEGVLRFRSLEWTMHVQGRRWMPIRAIRRLAYKLGLIYNDFPFWTRCVSSALHKLRESVKPDLILCTYPPTANLILGYHMAKEWNVPLVLDFRDGFCFEPVEVTCPPILVPVSELVEI